MLVVVVVAVLIWSGRMSGLDPAELWHKRDNAWEFVFGRPLDDADVRRAEEIAERQLHILAQQEAREAIVAERRAAGQPEPAPAELARLIDERAAHLQATLDPAERDRIYRDELQRSLGAQRGGFFPPELGWSNLKLYGDKLLETVAIAIWGTLIAVVLSIPAALLAADRSLQILAPGEGVPSRVVRWLARNVVRRVLDVCRGFNEYVMALVFVAVIGLGPFPGVLALAVHTFGMLGKIISEAIETIDEGPVEGVAATGASGAQAISFAVLPQVMPYIVSQSLLRFESNVRSATVLGRRGGGRDRLPAAGQAGGLQAAGGLHHHDHDHPGGERDRPDLRSRDEAVHLTGGLPAIPPCPLCHSRAAGNPRIGWHAQARGSGRRHGPGRHGGARLRRAWPCHPSRCATAL